jgi:SAM-dependent methyltransferase
MNGTLKRNSEWQEARAIVEAAGLPPYYKPPAKSWDALRACNCILSSASVSHPVLDVGGLPNYSFISTWLAHYGFQVDVINPTFTNDSIDAGGKIRYLCGDATRCPCADQHYGAVTCLSVIEHGIPLEAFFREMHRVLIPDGYLIVSTDFWHEGVDTANRRAFGVAVRIFTPQDIREIVSLAIECGFQPTGLIDFRCVETTVQWLGLNYTFIDFGLRRLP